MSVINETSKYHDGTIGISMDDHYGNPVYHEFTPSELKEFIVELRQILTQDEDDDATRP